MEQPPNPDLEFDARARQLAQRVCSWAQYKEINGDRQAMSELNDAIYALARELGVRVSVADLAFFNERDGEVYIGHSTTSLSQMTELGPLPMEGRGCYLEFVDPRHERVLRIFDFDNPNETKFIKKNKKRLTSFLMRSGYSRDYQPSPMLLCAGQPLSLS